MLQSRADHWHYAPLDFIVFALVGDASEKYDQREELGGLNQPPQHTASMDRVRLFLTRSLTAVAMELFLWCTKLSLLYHDNAE